MDRFRDWRLRAGLGIVLCITERDPDGASAGLSTGLLPGEKPRMPDEGREEEASQAMPYSPVKDGIDKNTKSVTYLEVEPPVHLCEFVHCFWQLKTQAPLPDDFRYHVVPDACVNILFDQTDTSIAAITAIHTTAIVLNLGKAFHFVGVQLLPGVWRGSPDEIMNGLVDKAYAGGLQLAETNRALANLDFSAKQRILAKLVEEFVADELIVADPVTAKILAHLSAVNTVAEMAALTGMSPRQLQRRLKQTTGFSPHDFLKVLRVQQSFRQNYLTYYADQSHYIHSFRKVTGYTPTKYAKKFDV